MKIHFVIFEDDNVMGSGIVDCGEIKGNDMDWQEEASDQAMEIRRLKSVSQQLIADFSEMQDDVDKLKTKKFKEYMEELDAKTKSKSTKKKSGRPRKEDS